MSYKRKTKDVVCKKCSRENRIPIQHPLSIVCCGRRAPDGFRCFGKFRLQKPKGRENRNELREATAGAD